MVGASLERITRRTDCKALQGYGPFNLALPVFPDLCEPLHRKAVPTTIDHRIRPRAKYSHRQPMAQHSKTEGLRRNATIGALDSDFHNKVETDKEINALYNSFIINLCEVNAADK